MDNIHIEEAFWLSHDLDVEEPADHDQSGEHGEYNEYAANAGYEEYNPNGTVYWFDGGINDDLLLYRINKDESPVIYNIMAKEYCHRLAEGTPVDMMFRVWHYDFEFRIDIVTRDSSEILYTYDSKSPFEYYDITRIIELFCYKDTSDDNGDDDEKLSTLCVHYGLVPSVVIRDPEFRQFINNYNVMYTNSNETYLGIDVYADRIVLASVPEEDSNDEYDTYSVYSDDRDNMNDLIRLIEYMGIDGDYM